MYLCETDVDSLVRLTQKFIDYLDVLHQKGTITKQQLVEMTNKKLTFIELMNENANV